jgi:transcriptional regulator with XRE-family HTH domain
MNGNNPESPILPSPSESRTRLRKAREAARKTPDELAQFVDNSVSWYHDLENQDNELYSNISIGQLAVLCSNLNIKAGQLFSDNIKAQAQAFTPEMVCAKIKGHLNATGLGIEEFENRIGFAIAASLDDPSKMLDWNVDCLRFVCAEIGQNWLLVLP